MLYGEVAYWVAGWVSVTCQYCIKMAKPILKVFRLSGSPIFLVSSDPYADTQFQVEPSAGALNSHGFQGHCILRSLMSENWCIIGTKLLKNTNRKPYTIYQMIPLSMTVSDL